MTAPPSTEPPERLPYFLHFPPTDHERGVRLGLYLRKNGVVVSWPGDERYPGLDMRIEGPKANVHLFLWSRVAMQYGRTSGFPGRTANPQNYLLIRLDDEPVPREWDRFHRADISGWEGDAGHPGLRLLVDALQRRELSQLPTGAAPPRDVSFSPSVRRVVEKLASQPKVSSWDVVRELISHHGEYGSGGARRLAKSSGPATTRTEPVNAWIDQVREVLHPNGPGVLHGRLLLLAMARLDDELDRYLTTGDFKRAVEAEIEEPISSLFVSPREATGTSDAAPLHIDSPEARDQLGRRAFSRTLARRLSRIWTEYRSFGQASFVLHLHGPWGTGKTTLLNFLREELVGPSDRRSNWIVVEFNAWQHQWLNPPWWPLLNAVYLQAHSQLRTRSGRWRALRLAAGEWWWRLFAGRKEILIAAAASFLLAALFLFTRRSWIATELSWVAGRANEISAVLALIGTLLSAILVTSRSLLSGSVSAARAFVEHSPDPMQWVHRHFAHLCTAIDLPIAVFIDDLDRCRRDYVVNLLEGIQTLFRNPRVVYVVAADRRWLHVCFETHYQEFAGTVHEPGRRLGSLFLEKAVQLSVSVPRLSEATQKTYWDYLLRAREHQPAEHERIRHSERERFTSAATQEEVFSKMQPSATEESDPVRLQLRREAAVEALSLARVEESTEYFLSPFAPLLDPNPRSMKRFVNAYALQRDLAVLAGLDIADQVKRKQLALWTIVCLRWPIVEEYLLELATKHAGEPGADVRTLLEKDGVKAVLSGQGIDAELTLTAVAEFGGLRASEGAAGTVA